MRFSMSSLSLVLCWFYFRHVCSVDSRPLHSLRESVEFLWTKFCRNPRPLTPRKLTGRMATWKPSFLVQLGYSWSYWPVPWVSARAQMDLKWTPRLSQSLFTRNSKFNMSDISNLSYADGSHLERCALSVSAPISVSSSAQHMVKEADAAVVEGDWDRGSV